MGMKIHGPDTCLTSYKQCPGFSSRMDIPLQDGQILGCHSHSQIRIPLNQLTIQGNEWVRAHWYDAKHLLCPLPRQKQCHQDYLQRICFHGCWRTEQLWDHHGSGGHIAFCISGRGERKAWLWWSKVKRKLLPHLQSHGQTSGLGPWTIDRPLDLSSTSHTQELQGGGDGVLQCMILIFLQHSCNCKYIER